jgi:hypothetical protein
MPFHTNSTGEDAPIVELTDIQLNLTSFYVTRKPGPKKAPMTDGKTGSSSASEYSCVSWFSYLLSNNLVEIMVVQALLAGLAPGVYLFPLSMDQRHRAASANLAEARRDAMVDGVERRKELRRRVLENKLKPPSKDDTNGTDV